MKTVNRNDPCPCGSGKKYKKCCGEKNVSPLEGLKHGIRMKGGVCFDAEVNGFIPIVHIWQNVHCHGEPEEWRSPEIFPTEEEALQYYNLNIRPGLIKMMSEIENQISDGTIIHQKLE